MSGKPQSNGTNRRRTGLVALAQTLALLSLCASGAGAAVVAGPVSFDGSNYWLFSSQTWAAAEAEAQALGGHLVTIGSAEEQDFVFNLTSGDVTGHWIGFNDLAGEGDWRWASGETPGYTHWNLPWEPNDGWGAGEDCALLEVAWGGLWNDLPCDRVQPAIAEAPIGPCDLFLYVPIYDGGTYQGGCNVQINGVVLSRPGCPTVERIHWQWGDGSDNDSWFAGSHSYEVNGSYLVAVTPYDTAGGSTTATVPLEITTCDPLGPVDPEIYRTDYQAMSLGSVVGQDGWIAGNVSCPDCAYPPSSEPEGAVVDVDSGQQALEVLDEPVGCRELGRRAEPPTKRFVASTFDFATQSDGWASWIFVLGEVYGRESWLYLHSDHLWSNAAPGLGITWHGSQGWHRAGIEVDTATGRLVARFIDGAWLPEDDSWTPAGPYHPGFFYFCGGGSGEDHLWIDNLRISESDSPRSSRAATAALDAAVAELPPTVFENANQQDALDSKLAGVFALIESGSYAEALDKLEHDVLKKTDGCATVGHPDNNDWIEDCASQGILYSLILDTIGLLQGLE